MWMKCVFSQIHNGTIVRHFWEGHFVLPFYFAESSIPCTENKIQFTTYFSVAKQQIRVWPKNLHAEILPVEQKGLCSPS